MDVPQLIKEKKIQAAVAGHDAGEDPFVGGLDEFVDQLGAGGVADLAALLTGGQPETDKKVGLAGSRPCCG